jgi:hypothetical protein
MRKYLSTVAALTALLIVALNGFSLAEEGGTQGAKFRLFGGAEDSVDPENPTNDVVRVNNTGTPANILRDLHKGTRAEDIDNQVQLKYFFEPGKTCTLGTPRVDLAIDEDGDGDFDGNAFGYLGDKPFGGGCLSGQWVFEDMTNNQAKWDLSQVGGAMTNTYDQMEAFLAATHPNYQILYGSVTEDPYPTPPAAGVTYYDGVVIGNRDVNTHNDTAP